MTLSDFIKIEPITKGWSKERKYCVTKADGQKYLLRISTAKSYEFKKELFDIISKVAELNIHMCRPIEFGTCDEGVYLLESWIDGEDAKDAIPLMSDAQQYSYGLKAGEILKKIHTIPVAESLEDWSVRFNRKIDNKIKGYSKCPIKFHGGEEIIGYINNNRHLLEGRPQCFQHGDYHIENMMIENGELAIIDFGRFDYGDPWEEFNRIIWTAEVSSLFASGMIYGYFEGEPPMEFWKLLVLYIGSNTIASVSWGNFGQSDLQTMLGYAQKFYDWYDGITRLVPKWYH